MIVMFKIIPITLYFIVGLICLAMAFKSLFAKKVLPFHEKAAGTSWNKIKKPLQWVILTLLRLSGLGFLVTSLLLIVFPIVNYFTPNPFYQFAVPVIALIFSGGLFIYNYLLFKNTKSDTPWKGTLYAIIIIMAGLILSLFN